MACMKRGAVDRISSETRGVGDCLWMHGHLIFFSLSSFTTTRLCTVYENYQKNMSFHIFTFKTEIFTLRLFFLDRIIYFRAFCHDFWLSKKMRPYLVKFCTLCCMFQIFQFLLFQYSMK